MESAVNILGQCVFIILPLFILFYFLQNRKTDSFVRGGFITACLFIIISDIINILVYMLDIKTIRDIFAYDKPLAFIPQYLGTMGYFLLAFGITFLIDKERKSEEQTKSSFPALEGPRRNIGISLLLFIVTMGIYFFFWLYWTVKDLKTNFESDIPYTPGKAVGFLFIPVFNIYWIFYILFSLPLKIKKIEDKHFGKAIGFNYHPVLIISLFLLFYAVSIIQQYRIDPTNIAQVINSFIFPLTSIYFLWLTLQAKMNAFFDFNGQKEQTI
jgi:hypothetical protein